MHKVKNNELNCIGNWIRYSILWMGKSWESIYAFQSNFFVYRIEPLWYFFSDKYLKTAVALPSAWVGVFAK